MNRALVLTLLVTGVVLLMVILGAVLAIQESASSLQACGEGWYHTMNALNEALIRLEVPQ